MAAGLGALVVLAFVQMWPAASQDFFHDESWRIDIVRSADPISYMRELHSTPTAVGWVYLMKAMLAPFPYSYTLARLVSFVWFGVFLGSTGALLYRIGRRPGRPAWSWLVPVLTCGCLTLMQVFSRLYSYFNNYMFEIAWVAVAMLIAYEVGRKRWAFGALTAMIATAPLFVIGALLAIPGLFLRLVVEARRNSQAGWRWVALGGAALGSAVIFGVQYLALYRDGDQTEPVPLDLFWKNDIVGLGDNGPIELVVRTLGQLQNNLVGWSWLAGSPIFTVITAVVLLCAGAVGVVELSRRWPWYVGVPLLAWLVVVPASAVVHIPVTAVRSNFAWMSLIYVIVAFGLVRSIFLVAERWPAGAVVGSVVMIALLFWHAPRPESPHWFARGLREDLEMVTASPAERNLVLAYHHMSQSYAHDVLINDDPPGEYEIVREWSGDRSIYDSVDELIADRLAPGDALWCIVPFALGPEESERACLFDDDRLHQIERRRGNDAEIRGYLVE